MNMRGKPFLAVKVWPLRRWALGSGDQRSPTTTKVAKYTTLVLYTPLAKNYRLLRSQVQCSL